MDSAVQETTAEQPSWHWLAYVSPVTSIMALTMYLAQDPTSSFVYVGVSIVCGIVGLIFISKAPKPVWPLMCVAWGIGFSCYVGWLAYGLSIAKAAAATQM